MNRRFYLLASVVMALSVILAACGGAATPTASQPTSVAQPTSAPTVAPTVGPKRGGTLTIGTSQYPPTLDPHASPSAITYYLLSSVGESLMFLTPDGELKPWLAESFEVTPDAKSYTFKLRKDVTFQDGTPFNAEAVKWNFDRIMGPDFAAGASRGLIAGFQSAEVLDEYTVRINFKTGYMPFLTNCASPILMMISPTATQQQGTAVNNTPVTTGRYRLTEHVDRSHAVMERWDGYNRTPPYADQAGPGYVDKIIWKFIPENGTRVATVESGETQAIADVPFADLPRIQGSKDFAVVSAAWVGAPQGWLMNVTLAPTNDVRVRQAINFALNLDALENSLYKGVGVEPVGIATAAMLNQPLLQEYYKYDVQKAKELLAQAGWDTVGSDGMLKNKEGKSLQIVINSIDTGAGPREIDQWVQGQLRAIGIDVQLKTQARAPWYEDNYGCTTNGPILIYRFADLDSLSAFYHSTNVGGFANWSCVKDPKVDQMLEAARVETDAAKRQQMYVELSRYILQNAYVAPLVDELSVWAVRSEVTGLKFNGFTYPIAADMYYTK